MAGASLLGVASPARSEPIQPFWVIPSVLSDNGLAPQQIRERLEKRTKVDTQVQHERLVAAVNLLVPGDEAASGWDPVNGAALAMSSDAATPGPISFSVKSGSADLQPSVNARLNRISNGVSFSHGLVPVQGASIQSDALNGRLSLSSDIIHADDQTDPRDFRDPQLRETPREIRLQDVTRRHKFAAKLIDSGNLRLMVDGEFGHVSDSFADNFQQLPTGRLVLPGSWSMMSSRIEFGGAKVSVGYQDYETRHEAQKREQVVVGFASSELQVYRKQASEFNLINGGQWLKRTTFSGINADLIVADVLPDAVAEAIDPIRPFLPTAINAGFERGDVMRSDFSSGPRDKISTANLSMTWDTRLGETTASIWQRQVDTDLVTPGVEKGVPLSHSTDRYADVSHTVRRGNWKLGAGLSLIQTNDSVLGVDSSGSEVAPHVSVAYAPERGAKVELRFGAADAQSQLVDDNLAARAKTKQLQLSVDVSDYVRDELNRPDAKLKLEYRYDFSGGDQTATTGGREREGGHALLVTFSTPLN